MTQNNFIKWLSELDKSSGMTAGGKGANLAEMYNSKFPVPPAFIITTDAYRFFVEKSGAKEKIDSILDFIDVDNTKELEEKAKEIRQLITKAEMPEELKEEIVESYENLNVDKESLKDASRDALKILKYSSEPVFVAVRSSATTEDLEGSSFAGQQESYLNVKGNTELIESVKKVFASLFTARAIYYRKKRGFSKEQFALAAVVQKMIDSDKSGVIFSNNPVKENDNVVIEAVFGLGEGIVSGRIKPDNYEITRELEIISKEIAYKKVAITRNSQGDTQEINLNEEKGRQQVLTDSQIKNLANIALKIESHYGHPQDIEFAVESNEIFIVQSRPITTTFKKEEKEIKGKAILSGLAASPGIASGKVRIIHNISELSKVKKGDVLVTEMTNPDMVVSMQKASAIITDEGGLTSHAAIVSREMGIPAVVGTEISTKKLKEGQEVTVDGFRGLVYEGIGKEQAVEILPIAPTRTKIKVIVDLPGAEERAAKTKSEAIGLLRLEGIIASNGKHPLAFEKQKKLNDYSKILEKGISQISTPFKEIWVRTSDVRSDEFSTLEGALEIEGNPMLGDHGIRFSLKHPEILKAELKAVLDCANKHKDKKFGIMIPQVISVEEVIKTKEMAKELGLLGKVKIGIMVETPSACLIIKDLLKIGLDFVSFGTNDLTQYVLAIDRNNEQVQHLFNELHPAVLNAIKRVLRTCEELGVESSICGQAGSKPEMVKFLIANGITSISVNADAAHEISKLIASVESKITIENKEDKTQVVNKTNYLKKDFKKPFNKNNNFKNKNNNQEKYKNPIKKVEEVVKKIEDLKEKILNSEDDEDEDNEKITQEIDNKKEESNQKHEIKTSEIAVPSYVESNIWNILENNNSNKGHKNNEESNINAIKELFGETILELPNNQYSQNTNAEEYDHFENNYLQEKIEPKEEINIINNNKINDNDKKSMDEVLDIF
ncbi:MAG: phosphoenolpyruvate synthase [Nanoarchaeota archaeon]